jgi:hypothetical protein
MCYVVIIAIVTTVLGVPVGFASAYRRGVLFPVSGGRLLV